MTYPITALRPSLRWYVVILTIIPAIWTAYVLNRSYQHWVITGFDMPYTGSMIRNGILVIVGVTVAAFAGHWIWKISQEHRAAATASPDSPMVAHAAGMLSATDEKYVLEIRAVGLAIAGRHQDTVWRQIEEKASNYETILSSDPDDYGETPDERRIFSDVATGASFEYAAAEAVDHWPLPVIIFGPPRGPESPFRAAVEIADARQKAGLGVTIFLCLDDANTDSSIPAIERLFRFFDEHPDVPAALVMSQDSMQLRWGLKTPGTQEEPLDAFVPPILDSMSALLVARTDRIDRLMRPYQVQVPGDIDSTKTQYDVVKLWNFYWDQDDAYSDEAKAAAGGHYYGPQTINTDWWTSKLPELWTQIGNRGPGHFEPSPFLPVRWTNWQIEEFDEAPLLGYLHRPVSIDLTTGNGKRLKRAERVKRLQDGWDRALATLPDGTKPVRAFYDTARDREWEIPVMLALHGSATGLDPTEVEEGYDIGRRLGNTGVSSALVQLALATMASYKAGGASATIHQVDDEHASIVMVSPPDDASKANNVKNRGENPFRHRMP